METFDEFADWNRVYAYDSVIVFCNLKFHNLNALKINKVCFVY